MLRNGTAVVRVVASRTSASAVSLRSLSSCAFSRSSQLCQPLTGTRAMSFSWPAPRKLDEIVKLESVSALDTAAITSLWHDHHATQQQNAADVWTAADWAIIAPRIKESPTLVLPIITKAAVAAADGVAAKDTEFWPALIQWQDNNALVTAVSSYQTGGTAAIPSLVITAYQDLLTLKQLVLVRGDVIIATDFFKPAATDVLRILHSLYADDKLYQQFTHKCNHKQSEFDFNALLQISIQQHAETTATATAASATTEAAATATSAQ